MLPLAAITPRSDARQPALGPSDPNGVTTTHTEPGASCGSASMVPGQPGVVSTMSAPARIDASSAPDATTLVLPPFQEEKRSDSPSGPRGAASRSGSPPGGS